MIQARKSLIAAARGFFETELCGLFLWDNVAIHTAEPSKPQDDGRRNPFGKHREALTVDFGNFRLTVLSPEESPPLGDVRLEDRRNGESCGGPIDHVIWKQAGQFVKERADGR